MGKGVGFGVGDGVSEVSWGGRDGGRMVGREKVWGAGGGGVGGERVGVGYGDRDGAGGGGGAGSARANVSASVGVGVGDGCDRHGEGASGCSEGCGECVGAESRTSVRASFIA